MTYAIAPTSADAVLASLELLAERGEDPTSLVYERLFALYPDYRERFATDTDNAVKGAMLSGTIAATLDFLDDPQAGGYGLATEMVTHEGYDIPREVFVSFFPVIREVARDSLADAWTAEFEAGWTEMVDAIGACLGDVPPSDIDYTHQG
jgi:hemoglobin-like flavoprotein